MLKARPGALQCVKGTDATVHHCTAHCICSLYAGPVSPEQRSGRVLTLQGTEVSVGVGTALVLTKFAESLLSQCDLHWTLIYSMVCALWGQHC